MSRFAGNARQPGAVPVAAARGDVNGDKIPDVVFLTGVRTPDSPFIQDITLAVKDGRNGIVRTVGLPSENAGYDPRVYLNDFTGDGVLNILISITSGGSGGIMYYYIYSYVNNVPVLIFNFNDYNAEYKYTVTYRDNYKVEVLSIKNGMKYILDITYKGPEYLAGLYDDSGRLKTPVSGFVDPLSGLFPVDYEADLVYELLAYQEIAGLYEADQLGFVQNILKWDGTRFTLDRQFVAIPGSAD